MRAFVFGLFVLGTLSVTGQAMAQGKTTRIETRPYYGAIVTEEAGVRVFRGLPPTERIIINPHGQTPLKLQFNEHRSYHRSESRINIYDHRRRSVRRRGRLGVFRQFQ